MIAVAAQRILRGAPATLEATLADSSGEPADASGAVTVTVMRSDGTVLVASTAASHPSDRVGVYTVALTGAQTALLDLLTAVWVEGGTTRATTVHEVVGGFYFTVAEARASDASLATAERYPDDEIRRVRDEVETEFESILGFALVPRYARRYVVGGCHAPLILGPRLRSIRAITDAAGTTWTQSQLDALVLDGDLVAPSSASGAAWTATGYTVGFEHGLTQPPPDLKRAALTRLRSRLNANRSGIPDRAQRIVLAEGASFGIAGPRADRTGVDEVDAVLERYADHSPVVA